MSAIRSAVTSSAIKRATPRLFRIPYRFMPALSFVSNVNHRDISLFFSKRKRDLHLLRQTEMFSGVPFIGPLGAVVIPQLTFLDSVRDLKVDAAFKQRDVLAQFPLLSAHQHMASAVRRLFEVIPDLPEVRLL